MSDLISRQAAIDAVRSYYDEFDEDEREIEERIADLPSAQSEPRWIPVTERLPKPNERDEDGIQKYYLIQNEFGDMMVAAYREKNLFGDTWWEQMYAYKPIADKVTAWMPLPEPYRKETEDESSD